MYLIKERKTDIHTYIHTSMDVSVAEWLAWLTSNCGPIGAIGSSPSNGLKANLWGQKLFNPLCQCVYVYVCIVNPDIQTIHRCSHTSIHQYIHTYIYIYWEWEREREEGRHEGTRNRNNNIITDRLLIMSWCTCFNINVYARVLT